MAAPARAVSVAETEKKSKGTTVSSFWCVRRGLTRFPGKTLVPISTVASIHLHNEIPHGPARTVDRITLVEGKGIAEGPARSMDHRPERMKKGEDPNWRHVSFMHRDELQEIERECREEGLSSGVLSPGKVRANVELVGFGEPVSSPLDFLQLMGEEVVVGTTDPCARLRLTVRRNPCGYMNKLTDCKGRRAKNLMAKMEDGRQGFFAEIIGSGILCTGDILYLVTTEEEEKKESTASETKAGSAERKSSSPPLSSEPPNV